MDFIAMTQPGAAYDPAGLDDGGSTALWGLDQCAAELGTFRAEAELTLSADGDEAAKWRAAHELDVLDRLQEWMDAARAELIVAMLDERA